LDFFKKGSILPLFFHFFGNFLYPEEFFGKFFPEILEFERLKGKPKKIFLVFFTT